MVSLFGIQKTLEDTIEVTLVVSLNKIWGLFVNLSLKHWNELRVVASYPMLWHLYYMD